MGGDKEASPERAHAVISQAEKLGEKDRLGEAVPLLERLVKKQPELVEAEILLFEAMLANGERIGARQLAIGLIPKVEDAEVQEQIAEEARLRHLLADPLPPPPARVFQKLSVVFVPVGPIDERLLGEVGRRLYAEWSIPTFQLREQTRLPRLRYGREESRQHNAYDIVEAALKGIKRHDAYHGIPRGPFMLIGITDQDIVTEIDGEPTVQAVYDSPGSFRQGVLSTHRLRATFTGERQDRQRLVDRTYKAALGLILQCMRYPASPVENDLPNLVRGTAEVDQLPREPQQPTAADFRGILEQINANDW